MKQYRCILMIADHALERPSPAMRRAVHLARATGAELYVYLFEHSVAIDALGRVNREVARLAREGFVRERESWLEEAVAPLAADLAIGTGVVWGAPAHRHVLDCIRELKPDLVIKDVHAEPSRLRPAPVDWKLLRLCPVPLLLVNREAIALPHRLIAAVEPVAAEHREGMLNDRVVDEARSLAAVFGATVHVAFSFEAMPPMLVAEPALAVATIATLHDEMRAQAAVALRDFAASHRLPPDCQHLLGGPPAEALASLAADRHADVLVLGTTRRSSFDQALFGSTAERILHHAACDVLAVKPEGFAESFFSSARLEQPLAALVG